LAIAENPSGTGITALTGTASAVPLQEQKKGWALAPEGMYFQRLAFPRRLKPDPYFRCYGAAEAVPFQSQKFLDNL
jgi:hypothetical protein